MKRYLKLLFGICLCFSLFVGCQTKKDAPASDTPTASVSQENDNADTTRKGEPLRIILDWYPNAIHSFLYVGMEKGYYAEEGIDLQIQMPSAVNDAMSMVAAGQAELGIYYQQDLILAKANQKVPLSSIGSIVQGPLNVVVALKEKNIHRMKDLEHKTVGYAGTELSETLIRAMVKQDGGNPDTVKLFVVGFDLLSSMTTKRVDATIGCLVNHEPPQLEKEGFDVDVFEITDYGIPAYDDGVLVCSEETAKEKKDLFARFLRASRKAFEDIKKAPDEAIATLLKHQDTANFPLSEDVEKKSLQILLPRMEQEGVPFLSQNQERWKINEEWLYQQGLLQSRPDPSSF